jgi:DNA-binding MarR family transcriptional regulator
MVRKIIQEVENLNPAPISDHELGVLLNRAKSAYGRARELELAQFGLTLEQGAILHVLQSKGGSATNDEIANLIIRQYHSVASMVNRMAKIGLVKKVKNKAKNKFIISMTAKGLDKYNRAPKISIKMITEDLTPEEKQQLAGLLQKILNKGRRMLGLDSKLPFLSEYYEEK